MKFLLPLVCLSLFSCANNKVAERKPVPPPGSDAAGSMPWNIPGKDTGQGVLGGMNEGR
ncbi:MAG: hypothetical protein ACSHYF_07225 [Verrucomicrobiaceae bacterium]